MTGKQPARPDGQGAYVVVSPVRDEERYVETTLRSMVQQTLTPDAWVIVDDGSSDHTPRILAGYAARFPWIRLLRLEATTPRGPGPGVVHAFNQGLRLVREQAFDFVVKLDCDVEFPADYFERLLSRFHEDERLGIASGVYLEHRVGEWRPVPMPAYHAAGASKVVRARCFDEIGGFVPSRGWDTVDEIKAQSRGWRTRHFEDIQFRHLKPEGSGIGSLRTNYMYGEVHYLSGGSPFFFLLKTLHRMLAASPPVLGGLAMLCGAVSAWASRRDRLVTPEEARFYRRQLNARLTDPLGRRAGRHRAGREAWRTP